MKKDGDTIEFTVNGHQYEGKTTIITNSCCLTERESCTGRNTWLITPAESISVLFMLCATVHDGDYGNEDLDDIL